MSDRVRDLTDTVVAVTGATAGIGRAGMRAAVATASADNATFPDVGGHITSVRVSHGPKTVGVTAFDAEMTLTTFYRFWLDTNPNDPGPEYMVEVIPDSDGFGLATVANFASSGKVKRCDGLTAFADTSGPEYAKIVVPRSCLGTPNTVRVAAVGYYGGKSNVVDWAHGEERLYPWVNR